jgi:hypothetical protein
MLTLLVGASLRGQLFAQIKTNELANVLALQSPAKIKAPQFRAPLEISNSPASKSATQSNFNSVAVEAAASPVRGVHPFRILRPELA